MISLLTVIICVTLVLSASASHLCLTEADDWLPGFEICNTTNSSVTVQLVLYNTTKGVVVNPFDLRYTQLILQSGDLPFCTDGGIQTEACWRSCISTEPINNRLKCGGDSAYCSNFTCQNNYACFCKMMGFVEILQVFYQNQWVNVTDSKILIARATCTIPPPSVPYIGRRLLGLSQPDIYVSLLNKNIILQSLEANLTSHMVLSKGTWNQLVIYPGGRLEYPLPATVYMTSGTLTADIYLFGVKYQTATFEIIGEKVCINRDCILCWDAWNNWSCLHVSQKIWMIGSMVLLFMLLVVAVPALIYAVIWIFWCLLLPIRLCLGLGKGFVKSRFMSDTKQKMKKVYQKKDYFFEMKDQKKDDPDVERSPRKIEGNDDLYNILRQTKSRAAFLCILILVPAAYGQCTSGVFVQATFTNCVRNGTHDICNSRFQLTTTLQNIGSSSCFTIVNGSELNQVLGYGEVKFLASEERIDCPYQYSSWYWLGLSQSNHRCCEAGPCPDNCPDTFPQNEASAAGQLNGDVIKYQGESYCRRSCGCAGCGCFLCCGSCVYSRWAIGYDFTEDKMGAIHIPGQKTIKPYVQFTVKDSYDKTLVSTLAIVTGAEYIAGAYTLKIIGSLSVPPTEFGNNKVIWDYNSGEVHFGPACDPNAPVVGAIGEVMTTQEGNVISGMFTGQNNYAVLAAGLFQKGTSDKSDQYTFIAPAYKKIYGYPKFPIVLNGNLWNMNLYEPRALFTNATNAAALLVTLETNQDIVLIRNVDLVCPEGGFINGSGCFSCFVGIQIKIKARSTCKGGPVQVQSLSNDLAVYTTSIILTTNEQEFLINGQVTVANVEFCISLLGNGGNKTICGEFIAVPYSPTQGGNGSQNGTTGDGGDVGGWNGFWDDIGDFFSDIFSGLASWWEYLLFIAVVVVLLVLFFFALPYIVKLVRWISAQIRKTKDAASTRIQRFKNRNKTKSQ